METTINDWFECRISYDKTAEDGIVKRVTEAYLVEAINFTEAEKRITERMQPFISGDFTVSVCNRRKYEAVLDSASGEGTYFYRIKLVITTIDEKTAKEKQENMFLFVQADDLMTALYDVRDYMKASMQDWRYHSVNETRILDVFRR